MLNLWNRYTHRPSDLQRQMVCRLGPSPSLLLELSLNLVGVSGDGTDFLVFRVSYPVYHPGAASRRDLSLLPWVENLPLRLVLDLRRATIAHYGSTHSIVLPLQLSVHHHLRPLPCPGAGQARQAREKRRRQRDMFLAVVWF